MKIDRQFLLQVSIVVGVFAALAVYPLAMYSSREVVIAAIIGVALATANVLAGYIAIEYSIDKSYGTFLKTVFGGMVVRMGLMLSVLVMLIEVFRVHVIALTVSLLCCYTVYLVLEVVFVQKKVVIKNQN